MHSVLEVIWSLLFWVKTIESETFCWKREKCLDGLIFFRKVIWIWIDDVLGGLTIFASWVNSIFVLWGFFVSLDPP